MARENQSELQVLNAAREVNLELANRLLQKVTSAAIDTVQNKDVGILGLAFKPHTNSIAGSASVQLAQACLLQGRTP